MGHHHLAAFSSDPLSFSTNGIFPQQHSHQQWHLWSIRECALQVGEEASIRSERECPPHLANSSSTEGSLIRRRPSRLLIKLTRCRTLQPTIPLLLHVFAFVLAFSHPWPVI